MIETQSKDTPDANISNRARAAQESVEHLRDKGTDFQATKGTSGGLRFDHLEIE